MKAFLSEDFLLDTETARRLYFEYAEKQPIFDWHCHISPAEIEQDRRFDNLAQLWLEADHYKWRAMRLAGVEEAYITGAAPDRAKYDAWVKTLSRCIGNPLYHWTHLELSRCFGIDTPLNERTADEVWEKSKALLASPGFSVRGLLKKFHVKAIFTTDGPAAPLASHKALRREGFETAVLPAFRPDQTLNIGQPGFVEHIRALGQAADMDIRTLNELRCALDKRMDAFATIGCRASDQSFAVFPFLPAPEAEVETVFEKALSGRPVTRGEVEQYRTSVLLFLAEGYAVRGWAMELHIGAMRNNNTRMFRSIGPDAGFDSIGDEPVAAKLSRFLDTLAVKEKLPKTVLFTINSRDNMVLAAMAGNFAEKTDGRLQLGTAWWFNDNRDGIEAQIRTYANLGVLGNFIGMVTDSRSFLSYPRHEYFRRILCNVLGNWVENGEFPPDYDALAQITGDICCRNAWKFFGM